MPFVDRVLGSLSASRRQSGVSPAGQVVQLQRLKEVLLATYGREPRDQVVKNYVNGQLWYEPRKDFSVENLSKTQKAVLREFDLRIAKARQTETPPKN
jgi:hypothetical protein